jgi:hypothetical protein
MGCCVTTKNLSFPITVVNEPLIFSLVKAEGILIPFQV